MSFSKTLVIAALCTFVGAVAAQSFPTKPITIVVPNPPGGVVDKSARLLGDSLAKVLGQTVILDNKGGASGNIAMTHVAKAPKDGYTLLASYSAYHVGNPAMFAKPGWEQKDLVPIALIAAATNVITTHPSIPATNLRELIAYIQKNPSVVNFASQGNGSLSHVGTVLLEQETSTKMTHVPYKGSGAAIADVVGGQVQLFMTTPTSVLGHIQSGKLRAYAVTSKTRHPMLPNVPTTTEAGLPGFELEAWVGLFAPAGTPPAVANQLTEAAKKALETPEAKARGAAQGVEVRFLGQEALAALVKRETDYWTKVIKSRNITAD